MIEKKINKHYLEGLYALRFFAAFLVLIGHCRQNLSYYGIDWNNTAAVLYKGWVAVDFFFVLSGFLLTYLARLEYDRSGSINIKAFFVRRVLRIFPLYYLSVFLGYFLLGFLYPLLKGEAYFSFAISEGLPLHLFFLPNYVIAACGDQIGAIYSLWSIGVEEQFYLFFPFLMIWLFGKRKDWLWLLLIGLLYFLGYYLIQHSSFFDFGETMLHFCFTLRFHFMLYGGVLALLYYHFPQRVSDISVNYFFQVVVLGFSLAMIFFPNAYDSLDIVHGLIFGALILVVSNKKNRLINLETPSLIYLGTISYGIYIFHPFVSYFLRLLLEQFAFIEITIRQMPWIYYFAELLGTVLVAHISFQYFESYFLKKKSRLSA